MTVAIATTRAPLAALHARFAPILPVILDEGTRAFRSVRSREDREDAVAEAALTAWERFLQAVTESVAVDPIDLARRAVDSVRGRFQQQRLLAA